ncbi:MAG: peptidoglycan DD-metalloendopeptidase family protein [Peptococcia bacterium]
MIRPSKLVLTTMLIITLSASAILAPVQATETEKELREKQEALQQQIEQTEQMLNQKKNEESKAVSELRKLNNVLTSTNKQLQDTEKKLSETENELSLIEKDLEETEVKLSQNTDILCERLKAMYINGETHILEVLFGSTSITDLLTRWDLFGRVAESDSELITEIKTELAKYEEQQQITIEKRNALAALKSEQSEKKREIAVASSRQQELVRQVQNDKKAIEAALDELEEQDKIIEAELRKLAESDGTIYGTGKLVWPAPGYSRITSKYGMRRHPILKTNRMHTGVDIAVPMGGKIVAADDGKVIQASYRGANGNMIMINHGNGIVTAYCHLSAYAVKVGDIVIKGQKIGEAGSTGWSTGPHLHFEVRKNGATQDPLKYVKYSK